MLFKILEYCVWKKQTEIRNKRFQEIILQAPSSETGTEDTDFYQQYVNIQDMRLDINRVVVLTDIFLSMICVVLSIIELAEVLKNPVTIMTRVYLKLPFLFCLWNHHQQLKNLSEHKYPKIDKKFFKSYKDKVLFVLKKIVSEYGMYSDLSQAINDLNWCTFIIENDYLQISNSISSSKPLSANSNDEKVSASDIDFKKNNRRFSKTTSAMLHKNKI
jgi:hypothetical protein